MDEIVPYIGAWMGHNRPFLEAAAAGLVGALVPLVGGTSRVLVALGGILAFSGRWRPFSPNWLTAYSLAGTLGGFGLYLAGHVTAAVGIACFCGLLDRLDGRSASALDKARPGQMAPQGLWEEMNHPGGTDLGKALDPFCDKLKCLAILYAFAWLGLVSPWVVTLLAVPETFGTLLRRPFYLMRHLQKESGASGVGKVKALFEWVAVISCVPFHQGWMSDAWTARERAQFLDGQLILCAALAAASVLSRLRVFRDSLPDEALKRLDRGFGHD